MQKKGKVCFYERAPVLIFGRTDKVLGVSAQGFYKYLKHTPSKMEQENTRIIVTIKKNHEESLKTYGYRRHLQELLARGERVSKGRVLGLMKANGILAKRKKSFRHTQSLIIIFPYRPISLTGILTLLVLIKNG